MQLDAPFMNLTLVGTSRCDVPARETAGGIVAPLNAARTAQRAVPTRFKARSGLSEKCQVVRDLRGSVSQFGPASKEREAQSQNSAEPEHQMAELFSAIHFSVARWGSETHGKIRKRMRRRSRKLIGGSDARGPIGAGLSDDQRLVGGRLHRTLRWCREQKLVILRIGDSVCSPHISIFFWYRSTCHSLT